MFELFLIYCIVGVSIIALALKELPVRSQTTRIAVVFVVLCAIGQSAKRPRLTYPFDYWGMYAGASPVRSFYEFIATTADARDFAFPFTIVSPMSPGPLSGFSTPDPVGFRLIQLNRACACDNGDIRLDAFIKSLAQIHEHQTGHRLIRFAIYERPVVLGRNPSVRVLKYQLSLP